MWVVMPYDFESWQHWRFFIKEYSAVLREFNHTANNGRVALQTPCKEVLLR